MTAPDQTPRTLRLTSLSRAAAQPFDLRPDAAECAAIASDAGLSDLRKLRLHGTLHPVGVRDWDLVATLGATLTQPCVVTLAPVRTRIDEPVVRRFRSSADSDDATGEVEMPDDTLDPLPDTVNLLDIIAEAVGLAAPAYPRAAGVELPETVVTAPGAAPLTAGAAHPFAALAKLRGGHDDTDA